MNLNADALDGQLPAKEWEEKPVLHTLLSDSGSGFQAPRWEADDLGALEAQSHPHGDTALEQ